jgi:hypothetical protein
MRLRWPEARIIHELQLEQGGVRIDLAAVTTDSIAVAEIKSEKDVLKRLRRQIAVAHRVAEEVWVVVAAKHRQDVRDARQWRAGMTEEERADYWALSSARFYFETGAEGEIETDVRRRADEGRRCLDPRLIWEMMWAEEQALALRRFWGTPAMKPMTRGAMRAVAVENMTGREIRRACCAALRARSFPRADAPRRDDGTANDEEVRRERLL